MDADTVQDFLALLREHGWEKGVGAWQRRIEESGETQACATYRYFVGWMAGEEVGHAFAGKRRNATARVNCLTLAATVRPLATE